MLKMKRLKSQIIYKSFGSKNSKGHIAKNVKSSLHERELEENLSFNDTCFLQLHYIGIVNCNNKHI